MLIHEGNHIGDSWYFVKDGTCHCFYLTCPVEKERHTVWEIAHATSGDLINWRKHGIVVKQGHEGEWDCHCLSMGSIIERNGRYWMAYTGEWNAPIVKIGIAVSDDLFHWEKVSYNPILTPSEALFSTQGRGIRKFCHWRDPKLMEYEGKIYALICATSKKAPIDACGAVAICQTEDMQNWDVTGEVSVESVCQELECPQIYYINGVYVLLFSCFKELFSEDIIRKYGNKLRQTSYYMVSNSIWGPYKFVPDFELLPADCTDVNQNVQYANQLIKWNGRWYILGTVWSEDGDYIADGREVRFSKGKLFTVDTNSFLQHTESKIESSEMLI